MQVLQLVFDAWVDVLCSRAQQVYACSLHVQIYICISAFVRLRVHAHPSLSHARTLTFYRYVSTLLAPPQHVCACAGRGGRRGVLHAAAAFIPAAYRAGALFPFCLPRLLVCEGPLACADIPLSATTCMTPMLRHFRSESGLARDVVSGAVLAATTAVRTVDGYCNSFTLGH